MTLTDLPTPTFGGGYDGEARPRMGFFTDTSICIGCKACEVACKEWNLVPEDGPLRISGNSYDNTMALGANTWRHVAFIEQAKRVQVPDVDLAAAAAAAAGARAAPPCPGWWPTTGSGPAWRVMPMKVDLPTPTFGGGYDGQGRPRMGFFTDTSVCIGCKACEVACKEWNLVPQDGPLSLSGNSYDNTMALGASTWRHVAFVEQQRGDQGLRWLMSSDVCKHCSSAACLEVCPTGALFRTEFGTVVVQPDVCNGCGYCVPACPFGVIDRREEDGRAFKCTLCYDRLRDGLEPACAKACPTDSIQFGELDELRARAERRVATLQEAGVAEARLYLEDEADGIGGAGAFFLLLDEPEVYGFPPDPVVPTRDLPQMWRHAALAAAGLLAGAVAAFFGGRS